MVKPVPWTNSCVISIQSYLPCRTCDKQHRHTRTTVPFFHPSETLCNTPKHFHFIKYSSQSFSNKVVSKWKKKKNAPSFSLKIWATPESKMSKLKNLIKEEEICVTVCPHFKGPPTDWGGRGLSKKCFKKQTFILLSIFTISSSKSSIKCEVWLVLPAPKHSALLCTL